MKKVIVTLVLVLVSVSLVSAASIEKQEAYIKQLESKLHSAKERGDKAKIEQIKPLLQDAKDTLESEKKRKAEDEKDLKDAIDSLDLKDAPEGEILPSVPFDEPAAKEDGAAEKTVLPERERHYYEGEGAGIFGKAYISYVNDLMENGQPNQFDISKVFIDYRNDLDGDVSVRFSTDIKRQTYLTSAATSESNINVYLKYAYFTLNDVYLEDYLPIGVPYSMNIRIGQSPTHWIGFMEKFWNFRYVSKTLTDQYSLFPTADLGIAALGALDFSDIEIPGLEELNYHFTFMNGNGYMLPEDNPEKNLALRLDTQPVYRDEYNNLTVGVGFYARDLSITGGENSDLFKALNVMGALQFESPSDGVIFAEYARATNQEGMSFGGQYGVGENFALFGRLDNYDMDRSTSGVDYTKSIYGIAYNWGENVKLALDYQNEQKNGADSVKIIGVHSQVAW
ncbi:MAG: cell envelope integrity protein TolA [Candidatus Altiarchaeota archaeon]|nr:cell envelope integrity protein TolA [Candidatus Altiarchaeota archaeon]